MRLEGFVIGDRATDIEAAQAAGLPELFAGDDLDAFVAGILEWSIRAAHGTGKEFTFQIASA